MHSRQILCLVKANEANDSLFTQYLSTAAISESELRET
jgi:hypothetical protein